MTAKARTQKRLERSQKPYYKWIVLGTVVFSLLIILLDITVVNVSIPHILRDFRTDIANVQWVFNAYTLAFAAALITFGRLGDMYGHKRLFILGLAVFGVSSALSGAAPNINWLIAFRALQGLGGAMMMPATLSLMLDAFPPQQRGLALGFWGAMAGVALAIGPILGGFITDHYTWRWIFYINVPICLLAFTLTVIFIQQRKDILVKHKLDIPGLFTITFALLSLTFALIEGQKYGWGSVFIVGLFTASFLLFGAFAYIERRAAEPMVNLKLFGDRNFTVGNAIALLVTFAMLGSFFLIPLYLQQVLDFSAVRTGLSLTPLALAMFFAAPLVGRLSDKFGGRWFMFSGLLIVSGALFWLSHFSLQTTRGDLVWPFIVFGLGMACVMPVMLNVALGRVAAGQYGAASGVLNTSRQVGGVLGVAVVGVFFTAQLSHLVPPAVKASNNIPEPAKPKIVEQFSGGDIQLSQPAGIVSDTLPANLTPQQQRQAEQTQQQLRQRIADTINPQITEAVNRTFRFAIIFTLLGALIALTIRQDRRHSKQA